MTNDAKSTKGFTSGDRDHSLDRTTRVDNPDPTFGGAKDELEQLVRDAASIVPVPKSDYRARLLAWRDAEVTEARVNLLEYLLQGYPKVDLDGLVHDALKLARSDLAELTKGATE